VRFTEDEIAEAADLAVPADLQPSGPEPPPVSAPSSSTGWRFPFPPFVFFAIVLLALILRARRRSR
jgi:hypothetical protein